MDREQQARAGELKFSLKGQLPSGKNQIEESIRFSKKLGRHYIHKYPNDRFVKWRRDACNQLRHLFMLKLDGPLAARVRYWPGDLRTRDVPGMIDAICHLFEHIGLLINDKQAIEWHWEPMELDRPNPRAEFTLWRREGYERKKTPDLPGFGSSQELGKGKGKRGAGRKG